MGIVTSRKLNIAIVIILSLVIVLGSIVSSFAAVPAALGFLAANPQVVATVAATLIACGMIFLNHDQIADVVNDFWKFVSPSVQSAFVEASRNVDLESVTSDIIITDTMLQGVSDYFLVKQIAIGTADLLVTQYNQYTADTRLTPIFLLSELLDYATTFSDIPVYDINTPLGNRLFYVGGLPCYFARQNQYDGSIRLYAIIGDTHTIISSLNPSYIYDTGNGNYIPELYNSYCLVYTDRAPTVEGYMPYTVIRYNTDIDIFDEDFSASAPSVLPDLYYTVFCGPDDVTEYATGLTYTPNLVSSGVDINTDYAPVDGAIDALVSGTVITVPSDLVNSDADVSDITTDVVRDTVNDDTDSTVLDNIDANLKSLVDTIISFTDEFFFDIGEFSGAILNALTDIFTYLPNLFKHYLPAPVYEIFIDAFYSVIAFGVICFILNRKG